MKNGEKRFFIQEGLVGDDGTIKLPDLCLTPTELTALMLLWGRSDIIDSARFSEEIDRAFQKIFALNPQQKEWFQQLSSLIFSGSRQSKDYEGKEGIIDDLMEAMVDRRICRVIYHSFYQDKIKSFDIYPLYLFQRDGGIYLFCTINDYTDIKALAVERIRKLELTDVEFSRPEDFNAREYLENTFNLTFDEPRDYVIRFTKDQARYVKQKRWTKNQEFLSREDGSLILKMHTAGYYDVKRWVLSFGRMAQVLAPPELRDDIRGELEKSLGNYA